MNNELISGPPISTPTLAIKGPDVSTVPEVAVLSDKDFRNFIDTGIYVVIDTPVVKTSRQSLFAVNLEGYIPPYNTNDNVTSRAYKNHFPVQSFESGFPFIHIFQEQIQLHPMMLYSSHRKIKGSINVGMRISSNTAQSGNLTISQASGVKRKFYNTLDQYRGLKFVNTSEYGTDFAVSNFALADLSLNRNVAITTTKREQVQYLDLPQKLKVFTIDPLDYITKSGIMSASVRMSQFTEDWLIFSLVSNLPNQNADQVTIRFFFDFSQIEFECPIFPIIPTVPSAYGKQILAYSSTFNNFMNPSKATYIFLPAASPSGEFTEEEEELAIAMVEEAPYVEDLEVEP